jgi:hypothetical protein
MQISLLFAAGACAVVVAGCVQKPPEPRTNYYIEKWNAEAKAEAERAEAHRALCARIGVPKIGMTQSQVLSSCWGKPLDTVEVTTERGKSEGWRYGDGNNLYFMKGVLVRIEAMP